MKQVIKDSIKQLEFDPIVENAERLFSTKNFIVSGMGGSHLAADLIKTWRPSINLIIHHDYGLPSLSSNIKNYLTIISSFSGNTEEAIDGFNEAVSKKIPLACVSTGGKLLDLAIEYKKPYIKIPDIGIKPRSGLGFSMVSLLKLMGEEGALLDIKKTAANINMNKAEKEGKTLAKKLQNFIPIIYSSARNGSIAFNWKIRFNETGKVPSFYNTFPELNHNEIVGFNREKSTKKLSNYFYFIFLKDIDDHPRVKLRMDVLKEIYKKKELPVKEYELKGNNIWEKIFSSLFLADWAAYYTAMEYNLNAQETEIIDRFKKIMNEKGSLL